jgi:hypothetical protein
MRILLFVLIVVHGLIHLLGFVKAFKLAPVSQLTQDISRAAGLLWLLGAALFVIAGVLFLLKTESWWILAALAVVVSQALIIASWSDAKFGTLANVIVVLALVPALAETRPGSFSHQYEKAVREGLGRSAEMPLVTEGDLAHLPAPVQKYLRYAGAVGKPQVRNVRAAFTGKFRANQDSGWMDMTAEQTNFFDDPTRVFYIKASRFGLPFDGLHVFRGASATMQIRLASLLTVVDAKGPQMNQGETVTFFNDMCFLAPATLIDPRIQWEPVNGRTVKARYMNQGITIGAELRFNDAGELVDFISNDRFLSADGKTYKSYPWSTPVRGYRELDGRRIWTEGDAIWHTPEGEFAYGRFILKAIEDNGTAR